MAGIGIKLNRIFKRHTLVHTLYGSGYSMLTTVTPMLVVIGTMLLMYIFLEFNSVRYYDRELFSCTILYIFIFSLLAASPFNSVLSKYVGDRIFEERHQDILPCIYVGMALNIGLAALIGIPFHIWAYFVGEIPLYWVFTAFCGFMGLSLCFYQMLYLSIVKAYKTISMFFTLGMLICFLLSLIFRFLIGMSITYSMLLSMTIGFFLIACLEFGYAKTYFHRNSHHYREVLSYFRIYWKLIFTNFLYILGLFIHNFVFWTKEDMRMVLADTYVCNQPYDMASCIAMFTNLSASIIFIAYVEMNFHKRYQEYTEAVLGGRLKDVIKAKKRMFRLMGEQLMRVTQLQYIISVVVFLLGIIFLPRLGMTGLVMNIYPCLAAGYFVLFLLYTIILFLQYFNDLTGSMLTSLIFVVITGVVSIFAKEFPDAWYGIGVFVGSIAAWSFAYMRMRWLERKLDEHIFCRGTILEKVNEPMPDAKVYDLRQLKREQQARQAQKERGYEQ